MSSAVRAGTVVALLLLVAACGSSDGAGSDDQARPDLTGPSSSSAAAPLGPTASPTTEASPWSSSPTGPSVRERLGVLAVDDRPSPGATYRRDDWSHWDDVDGNGCDARQDTLIRWSTSAPSLDQSRRCKVLTGTWVSPYDGAVSTSPAQIDIDHLVPLAEAHRSGGWQWDPALRRRFANDPIELVAASSASNQAKGDDRPDEWRPPRTESWCAYADGWVTVKQAYGLTVTTSERDALGQMLDTCTPGGERWPPL